MSDNASAEQEPRDNDTQQPATPVQEQPIAPASAEPAQQYGPAPVAPQALYQQQPVNQQYFAQSQAAPVQYVVMAESLKGVKGWLLFFVVLFAISGLTHLMAFFVALTNASVNNLVTILFSPILAIIAIGAVVAISMQKKLGKWLAVALYGVGALSVIISTIITADPSTSNGIIMTVGSIVGMLVGSGLMMLYFFVSRRVKETLIA